MLTFEFNNSDDIKNALDDFKILFAYHSNKIENNEINYHDTRDIFENGKVVGFNGNPRTLFEIQNQKDCYSLLVDKIAMKEPITEDLIKLIHKTLVNGTYDDVRYNKGERPGEYKKGDYIIGKDEIGSLAENVQSDINELLEEISHTESNDILTIVSYFHCRFESIHPFADGNGRVGRTLLNYYLMINNIRPLIIYDEDKKLYYECLQVYDNKQDIEPLKKFLSYEQEKTWEKKNKEAAGLDTYLKYLIKGIDL